MIYALLYLTIVLITMISSHLCVILLNNLRPLMASNTRSKLDNAILSFKNIRNWSWFLPYSLVLILKLK